jgi:hypothetical protein
MAENRRKPKNRTRRRYHGRQDPGRAPMMIFPSPYAAATFLAQYHDYPLSRVQFSIGNQHGYFPEETHTFGTLDEAWVAIEDYQHENAENTMNHPEITGHENRNMSWTPQQYAAWKQRRREGRAALQQRKPYEDGGWVLQEDGSWINDQVHPENETSQWEQANNEWKPAELAAYSATAPNAEGIVQDIDEAALMHLRRDMVTQTAGIAAVHEDRSLNPSSTLYCIKILLMQHGTRAVYEHTLASIPKTEIERTIAKQKALYDKMRQARRDWVRSGQSDTSAASLMAYYALQHENCKSLMDQLKLTQIVGFKLAQIDKLIKELATDIEDTHWRISEAEEESGRLLDHAQRVALCLSTRGGRRSIDITHSAAKILQLATMIVNYDGAALHPTRLGQKIIIEEVENALAILKLYSILDIYGGNGDTAEICGLVNMQEYDSYLGKLARATPSYRASLYEGRLLSYPLIRIPCETLKRATQAFKLGIGSSINSLRAIAEQASTEGLRTTLSCQASAVYGRFSGALFGALREWTADLLTPAMAEMEHKTKVLRQPLTLDEIHALTVATASASPREAKSDMQKVVVEVGKSLTEASQSGLEAVVRDPQFQAFSVMPAGHNHWMYYIYATEEYVEMDPGNKSVEEFEADLTRYAIRASYKGKSPWREETQSFGGKILRRWVHRDTGEVSETYPFGAIDRAEIDDGVEALAGTYERGELQEELAHLRDPRDKAFKPTPKPSAARLQEIGSDTGIMDHQNFAGRVDPRRLLQKEVHDMTAYLLSGPNYERGNRESVPYQYQGHMNNEEQAAFAEWRPEEGENEEGENEEELNNEEQAAYAEWRPEAREELNNEEQAAYAEWRPGAAQGNWEGENVEEGHQRWLAEQEEGGGGWGEENAGEEALAGEYNEL